MIPVPFATFSDPLSSWSHLFGAVAFFVAAIFLAFRGRGNGPRMISLIIYSFALVFLFSMSGVFHWMDRGGVAREVMKRLDHAGIWTLIAGTFVPVHMILFRGGWRWAVLLVVCGTAILGLVLELVFFNHLSSSLLIVLYLTLGWAGAISGVIFHKTYKHWSLWLLTGGGIMYSIGAVMEGIGWPVVIDGMLGPHEVFHICVLIAAALHWSFIYYWASHPTEDSIMFYVSVCKDKVTARAVGESLKINGSSVEEVKKKIIAAVRKRYHSTIIPKIRLRYFQEEDLE